jgi:hypothetical protein
MGWVVAACRLGFIRILTGGGAGGGSRAGGVGRLRMVMGTEFVTGSKHRQNGEGCDCG